MNESTKTKKALRGSLFALFLCIVLLIGTTFAWFTDSVTSGMNQIKSGNLKVGLQYSHDGGTNWKTVTENTDDIFAKDALWEPGHVEYANLKVANLGTLALKYQLGINIGDETPGTNVAGEQFKLSDYLNIAVVDGANTYATRADALAAAADGVALTNYTKTGELTPASADKSNEAVTVIVYMPETVGNEANYKTGTEAPTIDLGVKLTATQTPYENDSFDNQYDKNAASFDELKDAFANGGTIKVSKDINTNNSDDTANARMIISKKTTLNLDAKIISPDNMENNNTNFCALIVDADTTINASDNGGIDTGKNGGYALNVRNGATLTINGGDYYGGGTAVQVQKGTLVINGGKFACEPYSDPKYGNKFLINCIDAAYKDGSAKIIIKGGTFVNFDPSDSASENPHGNFVADGYKVVSETQSNGDIWYTVVPE